MRQKTKTSLPKNWLSWSQVELVEKNPKEYVERYVYDKPSIDTPYTRFGTKIHDKLAHGIRPRGMKDIPLYPFTNHELTATIKRRGQEITLYGILDGLHPEMHRIGEYKTATELWRYTDAVHHGQLRFYALLYYHNFDIVPSAALTCLETRNNLGTMELTGEHCTHLVKFTLSDILTMEARVWKAHNKIINLIEGELKALF